jgi:predicted Zn-dependent peptidase
MIKNQLREQQDRSIELVHFHYQRMLGNVNQWDVEDLIEQIDKVQKEDIQEVAKKIQLDTIYFLRDKEEV